MFWKLLLKIMLKNNNLKSYNLLFGLINHFVMIRDA